MQQELNSVCSENEGYSSLINVFDILVMMWEIRQKREFETELCRVLHSRLKM